MVTTRRTFILRSAMGGLATTITGFSCASGNSGRYEKPEEKYFVFDEILKRPVLEIEEFKSPLIIDTLELLRFNNNFLCRVRSKDGAVGISVANDSQMRSLYPVFTNRLQPYFIGKDARDLETLLDGVYVYQSNYKLQGLALWVPLATIEFAILDMLGRIVNKSIGQLIGDIHNPCVNVYWANGERGISPEKTIEQLIHQVKESDAKALKFKVGGRMSNNFEEPEGRTEKLIPLVRKTFGDEMVIYADSNGSYTTDEAIRIGRMMEEYNFDFYEEPVPFDWHEETKEVANTLSIPIAGGEQEASLHAFRWLIANDALDIVQPDMFYFGGMIRSMKVARMANAYGKLIIPHMSGGGLGYLYNIHFVSVCPNAGPHHEFKGLGTNVPFECPTSPLKVVNGKIKVPTGPGLGITIDPDFIKKHQVVKMG